MLDQSGLWKCETFDANDSLRASLRTHTIGQLLPFMPQKTHVGNDQSEGHSRRCSSSQSQRRNLQRYYEGLFVLCPLELKRELDELDLTEGERNECDWNSP